MTPDPRARSRASWLERACAAVIAVALLARLSAFQIEGVTWDVAWYATMGRTFLESGEFLIPWQGPDAYTQHYPPLYPVVLAAGFAVAGVGLGTVHVVAVLAFAFLVAVAFFTTRDLYGRERAWAVAALTAAFPLLLEYDANGFTESLVVAFFALTLWGVLKSLNDPRFVIVAGVFAALGYLTKASMGAFFILAAAGGFAWRFAFMRWRVVRDPYYLAAGGIFGASVLLWAWRNVHRHGWPHWETQRHASLAFDHMLASPAWPVALAKEALWSGLILLAFAAPALPGLKRALPRWREEATSGLLLAVLTPTLVAVFFVTAFYLYENYGAVTSSVNFRYLVTPLVPLLWLGFREAELAAPAALPAGVPESGRERRRAGVALAVAGVATLGVAFALDPTAERLSLGRVVFLYATVALGAVLVAASAFFRVRVATRTVGSGRDARASWRYVPEAGGARAAFVIAAFTLAGFVVAFYWALSLLPFFVAGGLAVATPDARARVAAVAVVFLGASLAHAGTLGTEPALAADIAAEAPPGATVGVVSHYEHFVWPFLPRDVDVVSRDDDVDFLVHVYPSPTPSPPANYTVWKTYPGQAWRLPGTAASVAIESWLTGEPPVNADAPAAFVYRRA